MFVDLERGLDVKSTYWPHRGPQFSSQHTMVTHNLLWLWLTGSYAFLWLCLARVSHNSHRHTHLHIKIISKSLKAIFFLKKLQLL